MSATVSKEAPVEQHKVRLDTFKPKNILMVVANPSTSSTLGWPVGFWASELAHPYHAFKEVGYNVASVRRRCVAH